MTRWTIFGAGLFSVTSLSAVAGGKITLKNFREINRHYSRATLVSEANAEVLSTFNSVKSVLPATGSIEEFTSPAALGLVQLAGAYCAAFIDREQSLSNPDSRIVHQQIDFSVRPEFQSPDAFKVTIQNYVELFLKRPATESEVNYFLSISDSRSEYLEQMLHGICGAVASSVENIIR